MILQNAGDLTLQKKKLLIEWKASFSVTGK